MELCRCLICTNDFLQCIPTFVFGEEAHVNGSFMTISGLYIDIAYTFRRAHSFSSSSTPGLWPEHDGRRKPIFRGNNGRLSASQDLQLGLERIFKFVNILGTAERKGKEEGWVVKQFQSDCTWLNVLIFVPIAQSVKDSGYKDHVLQFTCKRSSILRHNSHG